MTKLAKYPIGLLLLLVLGCSSSEDSQGPAPTPVSSSDPSTPDSGNENPDGSTAEPQVPSLSFTSAHLVADGSWPDDIATINVDLEVYSPTQTPTNLKPQSIRLYRPGDRAQPLLSVGCGTVEASLDFSGGEWSSVSLYCGETLNRDLASACGSVEVEIEMSTSSCDCSVVVTGQADVVCLLDNRAEAQLAEAGLPAPADKPCQKNSLYQPEGEVESLMSSETYRYDDQGRLLFTDQYDGSGALASRAYYTYATGVLLKEVDDISVSERLIVGRRIYSYDDTGRLLRSEFDQAPCDGKPEYVTTYAFDGQTWTESDQGSCSYVYDESVLTVTRTCPEGTFVYTGTGTSVYTLRATIDDPQLFFATTAIDGPIFDSIQQTTGDSTVTTTFSYQRRVLRSAQTILTSATAREEYLYDCP